MANKKNADLRELAWTNPDLYREVVTSEDAKAILLKYQGRILACGQTYDIVTSKPQCGTVTITLRKTEFK
jgi:hypothetical protein